MSCKSSVTHSNLWPGDGPCIGMPLHHCHEQGYLQLQEPLAFRAANVQVVSRLANVCKFETMGPSLLAAEQLVTLHPQMRLALKGQD